MPYYGKNDEYLAGMKIIPIDTTWLKQALIEDKKYRDLYPFFEDLHKKEIMPHEWQDSIILVK